jgi:hypothetical protein
VEFFGYAVAVVWDTVMSETIRQLFLVELITPMEIILGYPVDGKDKEGLEGLGRMFLGRTR